MEVLDFQVWMDAMAPKEREEILDFLENRDQMENRSEIDQSINEEILLLKLLTCYNMKIWSIMWYRLKNSLIIRT